MFYEIKRCFPFLDDFLVLPAGYRTNFSPVAQLVRALH